MINIVRAALSPAIVGMVTKVYVPTLFPLTFLIALSALWLDSGYLFDSFVGALRL